MPRTRKSLSTSHLSLSPRNGERADGSGNGNGNGNGNTTGINKVNREAAALNSPTAKKSPMRKKRTASDRSPVVVKAQRNTDANMNANEDHEEKENVTPTKMGVTPYWKVASERGGMTSPRLTRSTSKRKSKIPRYSQSPESQSSAEKSMEVGGSRQLLFHAGKLSSPDPNNNNNNNNNDNDNKFCLKLSPEAGVSTRTGSAGASKGKGKGKFSRARSVPKSLGTPDDHLDEISFMKARNYELLHQVALLKAEKAVITKDAEEKDAKMQQMAKEKESFVIAVAKLESQLESKSWEKEQQKEFKSLESHVSHLKGDLNDFMKSLRKGEADDERTNQFEKVIHALKASLDAKEALLKERDDAINELKRDMGEAIDMMEQEREENRQKMEISSNEENANANANDAMTMEIEKMEEGMKKKDHAIKNMQQQKEEMEVQMQDIKEKINKIKFSKKQSDQKYQEVIEMSKKNLSKAISELTRKEEELKLKEEKVQELGALLEGPSGASKEETEALENQVQGLNDQIESISQNLTTAEEREAQLQNEINQLQAALKESKDENGALEGELCSTADECEKLHAMLVQANTEKEELVTAKESLEAQLHEMNAKLQEVESKVLSLLKDLNGKAAEVAQAKELAKRQAEEFQSLFESTSNDYKEERGRLLEKITNYESEIKEKESGIFEIQKRCKAMMTQLNKSNDREGELLQTVAMQEQVRRSLHNKVMQLSGNIRVYVRVRPRLQSEASKSKSNTFSFPSLFESCSDSSSGSDKPDEDLTKKFIIATEPEKDRGGLSQRRKKLKFGFDNVFSPREDQNSIWKATEPLVQSAVDGYNVCVFAYGQTGSGKTYTMLGTESDPGLITRAVSKLFDSKKLLEEVSSGTTSVDISIELMEIYNESVRDLITKKKDGYAKLNISMNANEAVGNKIRPVASVEDVFALLAVAQKRRCVKATESNEESSRSHLIFTMNFVVKNASNGILRSSKLHICDLAGSERLKNSKSSGSTLTETKHINKSLSALSNVIEKLQAKSSHVPFRDSKLTFLLNNSLGGDSKTLAIICCNPLTEHFQESSCSLRFAQKLNKVELKALGSTNC